MTLYTTRTLQKYPRLDYMIDGVRHTILYNFTHNRVILWSTSIGIFDGHVRL